MSKINAYISLLFLTAESDYDLEQDEFYSDLYVVKRPALQDADNIYDEVNEIVENEVNNVKFSNFEDKMEKEEEFQKKQKENHKKKTLPKREDLPKLTKRNYEKISLDYKNNTLQDLYFTFPGFTDIVSTDIL